MLTCRQWAQGLGAMLELCLNVILRLQQVSTHHIGVCDGSAERRLPPHIHGVGCALVVFNDLDCHYGALPPCLCSSKDLPGGRCVALLRVSRNRARVPTGRMPWQQYGVASQRRLPTLKTLPNDPLPSMGPISTPSRAALLRCISSCVMGVLICWAYMRAQVHMYCFDCRAEMRMWGYAPLWEACRVPCRWAAAQAALLRSRLYAESLKSEMAQGLHSQAAGCGY